MSAPRNSEERCALCNRRKGDHKADNAACPFGRSRTFPHWHNTNRFTPKQPAGGTK